MRLSRSAVHGRGEPTLVRCHVAREPKNNEFISNKTLYVRSDDHRPSTLVLDEFSAHIRTIHKAQMT